MASCSENKNKVATPLDAYDRLRDATCCWRHRGPTRPGTTEVDPSTSQETIPGVPTLDCCASHGTWHHATRLRMPECAIDRDCARPSRRRWDRGPWAITAANVDFDVGIDVDIDVDVDVDIDVDVDVDIDSMFRVLISSSNASNSLMYFANSMQLQGASWLR